MAISLPSTDARAQTSTTSTDEAARIALAEGLRLRDEQRRPFEALPKFAEAYKLAATPITAYELGSTYIALGRLLEAHELFKAIGEMPPDPQQSARGKKAREEAKRLTAELDTKIPSIAVRLEGVANDQPVPRVTPDDKELELKALGVPHRVNPGEHKVTVTTADGNRRSKVVTTLEGKVELLVFDVSPGIRISLADRKQLAVIVGGAGAVGVGLSLLLGASAAADNSAALERHCGAVVGGQSENHCDYQGLKDIKSAGRRADLATVLFVIGGLGMGAGAILWITAPPPKASGTRNIGVGASLDGLHLRGGF